MVYLNLDENGVCLSASVMSSHGYKPAHNGVIRDIKKGIESANKVAIIYDATVNDILNAMEEESVDLPVGVADSVHATLLQLKKEINS